ncbi:MAG: UDP-N-acetylmuramate:L-alanyl-gamma-D-glutamyl-meso-diaminopimelate ligase [Bdellovibrionales bacterium RIFCSPHIGHO2_01_FULL_40_29]|nr:MAG: UDP-N-acetylmuramate:L-alanyl-gamma-D-glutamyl-meso-diaminopimelate ligase [Bdellovibrionales bacterium RIFCSPHIGHO2_01_FULL_40_29]OFZ35623.1 MAG: UDP-N-acetylmuramate:L-alanyl-gamma-D-glutamyl-meso-diaminopimelate ligase [Bdellovibrionales bacterium RIFCSPHIGHO2_02_FULL_40_15]
MAQSPIQNLKVGSHIHLMGVCGTAMASLAGLLKDRGFKVTGSDSNPYPPMSTQLESLGIMIQKPYQAENLFPKPDYVIVGNVISASNPEAQEMIRLDLPFCSLPQAMGELIIAERNSFVVAGTHGKTTTTSLLSWVAEKCGQQPGFLIGGIPKNFSRSFTNPKANTFIIEGDEYDTAYFDKVPKFIHYKPKFVILTSVEFDHADIYKDFAAVKSAFKRLAELVPSNGSFIYWGDDKNVSEIAQLAKSNIFSYGFSAACDYGVKVLEQKEGFTLFEIAFRGETLGQFRTTMTGNYNILNATAVIAQAHVQQWDLGSVQQALSTFTGVKRRQEILGEPNGILIIEDFAHHPTAVKETIKGIQSRYQGRKVFSVFEPRSATSRRKIFQKDYVEAFSFADEAIIAEAFDQGKISEDDRFSVAELVGDLKASGKTASYFKKADEIVAYLVKNAQKGDVILIMSNGGFDGIYQKLLQGLA